MKRRHHNRAVIGVLLLAALCTYADLPRLAGTLLIGGAVNYVAVLDGQSRAMLQARLDAAAGDNPELTEKLDDGRQSLAIIEGMPSLPGVVASHEVQPRLETTMRPPRIEGAANSVFLALIAGPVAAFALPPPTYSQSNQPSCPTGGVNAGLAARGPPLA